MGWEFLLNIANTYAWLFGAWSFKEISKTEDIYAQRISWGFGSVCSVMALINFIHLIWPWVPH